MILVVAWVFAALLTVAIMVVKATSVVGVLAWGMFVGFIVLDWKIRYGSHRR